MWNVATSKPYYWPLNIAGRVNQFSSLHLHLTTLVIMMCHFGMQNSDFVIRTLHFLIHLVHLYEVLTPLWDMVSCDMV